MLYADSQRAAHRYKMNTTSSREWSMATSSPDFKALTSWRREKTTTSFSIDDELDDNYSDYNNYDLTFYLLCSIPKHGAYFIPVLYTLFFLVGFLGNSLVLFVIIRGVRLRSMTDVGFLNLAIADLLLVCTLPFLAHQAWDQWIFGDAMCKAVLGVYHIVSYSGIFFLCLMSIDRYLAIVHAVFAMRARTGFFGMIAAVIIWIAGFCASFPDIIYLKQNFRDNRIECFSFSQKNETNQFWSVFCIFKMNILGLFVPLLIMGFCYWQILLKLLSCRTSKKQAIRLIVVVVAVFFCCWAPYNIVTFFKALELLDIYTACDSYKAIALALQITEAVTLFHSCLNPFLYVFVGEKFRRHLMRLINRSPCWCIKALVPRDRVRGSVYSQTTSLDERSTAV